MAIAFDLMKTGNADGTPDKGDTSKPPGSVINRFIKNVQTEWKVFVGYKMGTKFIMNMNMSSPEIHTTQKRSGQVCVLTGGARGIGFEIVKVLLRLDYTVVLGVRNVSTMENGIDEIRKNGIVTGKVKILHLDLKSLRSVRNFAHVLLSTPEAKRIDTLINNAGTYQNQYEVTEDNLECHFQVNYLSHFLLTNLLLPRIKETAKAKAGESSCYIVNTSSGFQCAGSLQFDNLANRNVYVPSECYCDTKLCQILHAKTVQSMLEKEGVTNVHMYSVAPGEIATDINKDIGWRSTLLRPLMNKYLRTVRDGANAILHPVFNPGLSETCGGKYFDLHLEASPSPEAEDEAIRGRLWDMSLKLTEAFSENK